MLNINDIHVIPCGSFQENAYLVCPSGRDDAFLVDPGDGLPQLQSALAKSGRALSAILLTHGHFDHILAAQPLADQFGAKVYIHAGDAEMLDDPDKSAYMPEVCRLTPPVGLSRELYGETVRVCGAVLQVLHTPGHSKGSVCLYDPEAGLLFSGDTLFRAGYGRTDLHGGSDAEIVQSLRALLTRFPAETIALPGHGGETTLGLERRRYGL